MPGPFDHPQRAAFAAHSWLIPRLLSRFKDPLVARQGHTGWTTRSAGRVRNGRFLAQGRRSASSLRTPRGLTTPARIRSISLCGDVDAAGIRMPLHRFAGTIRRNKHRDDRAHGRLQNPLAQNDVRDGEPSRRWEARWNKWKGQVVVGLWTDGAATADIVAALGGVRQGSKSHYPSSEKSDCRRRAVHADQHGERRDVSNATRPLWHPTNQRRWTVGPHFRRA